MPSASKPQCKPTAVSYGGFACQDQIMRDKIKLVSSAGTGFFYTTDKNKKTSTEKLRLKKYDPKVRKHVEFVEEKMR